MGRPKKQTVEYFPHFVDGARKTLFVLENNWQNDGYAFWFKLLELLCKSDGHYYDMTSSANRIYLFAFAKVSEETATDILNSLAELGKIDSELWEKHKIIWCQSLVDNLRGLYDKRTTPMPSKPVPAEKPAEPQKEEPEEETQAPEETKKPEEPETPSKKPRKQRAKKEGPPKIKYADFVNMTEEEYKKLVYGFGEAAAKRMIEILDNYKGSKGKTYASDYRAILSWVVDRFKEEQAKNGGVNVNGRNSTDMGSNGTANNGGFTPSSGFKPSGGFKG